MPIDKLQPQFLNLDDDERLISKVEMSDAQNVRTSVDAAGNALVLRNYSGENRVGIGTTRSSGQWPRR